MNYEEIGENIYTDSVMFVESQCIEYNIKLNDERYLEILTHKVISKSREFKSPLVFAAVKKKLRDYLKKYSPFEVDKEEIIDFYYKRAAEKIKLESANKELEDIDFLDISKIDQNLTRLKQIRNGLKLNDEVVIYDGEEIIKDNLVNGFSIGRIETGLEFLDGVIEGFAPGEFEVIAARPGVGKTALACQLISRMSQSNNIGMFSCEMSRKLIMNRVLACETGIDSKKLEKINKDNFGFLTMQEKDMIANKAQAIATRIIKIVDVPNINVDLLCEKAREMKKDYLVDIIIIDYIQLLTCSVKEDRRGQMVYITRALKGLARELDIPVIGLAQLNRDAENRRPILRDLKESGSIEEDADMVMFLHNSEEQGNGQSVSKVELIVAKNRNGKTGFIVTVHYKPISRFSAFHKTF